MFTTANPNLYESLVAELRSENLTSSSAYLNRETGRKINRQHPSSDAGISYQSCGGGRRVLRKRLGND